MKYLLVLAILALSLMPLTCFGAVAHDTQNSGSDTGGSSSFTVPLTTNSTNEVAIIAIYYALSTNITSVSGGTSVTWSRIAGHTTSGVRLEMWQGLCPVTNSSATITIQMSTSAIAAAVIDTYSGAVTATPVEASQYTSNASGMSYSGNVTTIAANSLVISYVGDNSTGTAGGTVTAGTGYNKTIQKNATNGTAFVAVTGEYATAATAVPGVVSAGFSTTISLGADQYVLSLAVASNAPSCWAIY